MVRGNLSESKWGRVVVYGGDSPPGRFSTLAEGMPCLGTRSPSGSTGMHGEASSSRAAGRFPVLGELLRAAKALASLAAAPFRSS